MDEMYSGKRDTWTKIKWFSGRVVRNVSIVASYMFIAYGSARIYNYMSPVTVYADREVIVTVQATSTVPAVMTRIAICESGNKHTDKNGQVLMKTNDNKSVDVGVMQINSLWFKKASDMKLDLTKEADNRKFADYLYQNYGTEPWVWSKPCWNK